MSEEYSKPEEIHMRVDREYFEVHPSATSFVRDSLPEEVTHLEGVGQVCLAPGAARVTVTQIAPGCRTRSFQYPENGFIEIDWEATNRVMKDWTLSMDGSESYVPMEQNVVGGCGPVSVPTVKR